MFAVRGRRGVPDRILGTRTTPAIVTALVVSMLAVTPSPAFADRIAEKKAEASAVWSQLQQSAVDLEVVVERYNEATVRLEQTEGKIADNKARLKLARANLASAQQDLGGALVAVYKSGEPDPLQTVLGARSITQLFDEVDLLQRATDFNTRTVSRVKGYRGEIVQRRKALDREQDGREEAVQAQASRRDQIEGLIDQREAYYAGLKSDIRRLIEERREAERRAVVARRQAAQATLAQSSATQVDTSAAVADIGGSAAVVDDEPATETSYAPPPASGVGAAAAGVAMQYLGVPYVWAGASPSGFDCSGLVVYAFAQAGRSGLPHFTGSLMNMGTRVSQDQLAPGDLVFAHAGHVGIYIGGGQMVHAPHSGDVVRVAPVRFWVGVRL